MTSITNNNLCEKITIKMPAASRSYDILVGEHLLAQIGTLLSERLGTRHCLIITDTNIAPLFLQRVEAVLATAGHTVLPPIIFPAGESSKSQASLQNIMNQIFERAVDRHTVLVALGGGVVGDLVGFAAAITLRGLDFIQVPTTLLSQVDSSVGGKTGINSSYGKNTIGAFYQPRLVLADVTTLDSLPARETMSGYAEIVKYGLIQDPAFFAWCQAHGAQLLYGDPAIRTQAITKSCAYKAEIVEQDERESGRRALLNLGHTFAHPLESVVGYNSDKLLHGEAVSIGMVMAFRLSVGLGLCPAQDAQSVSQHLKAVGLPIEPQRMAYNMDQLMRLMSQDKKAKNSLLSLVLVRGIGQAFVADNVDPSAIRKLWEQMIS